MVQSQINSTLSPSSAGPISDASPTLTKQLGHSLADIAPANKSLVPPCVVLKNCGYLHDVTVNYRLRFLSESCRENALGKSTDARSGCVRAVTVPVGACDWKERHAAESGWHPTAEHHIACCSSLIEQQQQRTLLPRRRSTDIPHRINWMRYVRK